jgi:hypothetical protein
VSLFTKYTGKGSLFTKYTGKGGTSALTLVSGKLKKLSNPRINDIKQRLLFRTASARNLP